MSQENPGSVTILLEAIRSGDRNAYEQLMPVVYDTLKRLADGCRDGKIMSLSSTEIVHEAYLRLMGPGDGAWENRRHFYGAASEAMRRVLVDEARYRAAAKRGGRRQRVPLEREALESGDATTTHGADLLALEDALGALESADPRAARVVTLRFFGGLSVEQIGSVLDVSSATVKRDWEYAKAWLYERINAQ